MPTSAGQAVSGAAAAPAASAVRSAPSSVVQGHGPVDVVATVASLG